MENYTGSVKEVIDEMKDKRNKNGRKYEYMTLQEFFFYACNVESSREEMIKAGISQQKIFMFQEVLNEYMKNMNKIQSDDEVKASEDLELAIRYAASLCMNNKKDVNILSLIKVIIVNKKEKDESNDKFLKIRELLTNFGASLEKIKDAEDEDTFIPLERNDDEYSVEDQYSLKVISKKITVKSSKIKGKTFVGREKEIKDIALSFEKKNKNSIMILGDSGVGKTSLVNGFGQNIADGKIPELKGTVIVEIDQLQMFNLIKTGTKVSSIVSSLLDDLGVDKEKLIIFIDDLQAYKIKGSFNFEFELFEFIHSLINDHKVKVICAVTNSAKKDKFSQSDEMLKMFNVLNVEELSKEQCLDVLKSNIPHYEKYYGVNFSDDIILKLVDLSTRYIANKKMPESVLSIVDDIGVATKSEKRKVVTNNDLDMAFAKVSNISIESVSKRNVENLLCLANNLKDKIFGQDEAVDKISDEILISKSNIGENGKTKPIGSFMFAGPTGVGKTEITNELGRILGMGVIRLDMSEYMEKHMASKITGSPLGYVGSESGSYLFNEITKNPHSIILFDEFEKAHPTIQNLLLQLLDNGEMTDSKGEKINFRHSIVIMTTNAGAKSVSKGVIGFNDREDNHKDKRKAAFKKELSKVFSPEFRNRIDHIVYFNDMNEEMSEKITVKKLNNVACDIRKHYNIDISFEPEIIKNISNTVFKEDQMLGARPIDRKIKSVISRQLSLAIVKGKISKNESAVISIDQNDEIIIKKKEMSSQETLENAAVI